MSKVAVHVVPQGRGYRLELHYEDAHIGEYERSWADKESGDLVAKVKEAGGRPTSCLTRASALPTAR